jgi:hypothetical protein
MAHKMKTLAHLRTSTRGASLTEYVALLGLMGGLAIGAVFGLSVNVQDDFANTQTRIDEVVRVANGGLAPIDNGSGGSGGTGTGGSGGETPPSPPADPFASCETGYGPNPEAIRGTGDGSTLVGGDDRQVFYALANAVVDGGEGGVDLDTLLVPGIGAVATFTSWAQPESGRIDLPNGGSVLFSNIEQVVLCDEGGDVPPPEPEVVAALFSWSMGEWGTSLTGTMHDGGNADIDALFSLTGRASTAISVFGPGPYSTHPQSGEPFRSASGLRLAAGSTTQATVSFTEAVSGLAFRIHDLDGELPRPAMYRPNGTLLTPAFSGYRDRVIISGLTESGATVYPTGSGAGVVSLGNGVFEGYDNRNCGTFDTDCNPRFDFGVPVQSVSVRYINGLNTALGGVIDVSDLAGTYLR